MSEIQTSDWLAIIGAITAFVWAVGSLAILWFGKIDLANRGVKEDLSLRYQKMFDLRIRNPALGMLFLGILFLCASYLFYLHAGVKDVKLQIALETDDPGDAFATFVGNFGSDHPDPHNHFEKRVPSNLHDVDVTITETGYDVWRKTIHLDDIQPFTAILKKNPTIDKPNPDLIVTPKEKLPPFSTEAQK